jgi:hypothetical protein
VRELQQRLADVLKPVNLDIVPAWVAENEIIAHRARADLALPENGKGKPLDDGAAVFAIVQLVSALPDGCAQVSPMDSVGWGGRVEMSATLALIFGDWYLVF